MISMRSLGGLILLAGIGVALFVYLPAPVDSAALRSAQLPSAKLTPVSRLGRFSPSIALSASTRLGPRLAGLETTSTAALRVAMANDAHTGWQTTVVSAATPAPTELAPRDPDARYKLVLDIQQQLRRVGCYWGRMDGSWGIGTKDAMKEFTDRVNATLPLDEPDDVQLALIQSHGDEVCGACPAGQSLSASGRCVGLPITAQAHTKRNTALRVAAEQVHALPSAPVGQSLFKPVLTTVASTEPLPGRMGIGGPIPTTFDAEPSAPPVTPGAAAAPPRMANAAFDPTSAGAVNAICSRTPLKQQLSSTRTSCS